MTYINAYPVTPDMGLRESINAMLYHIADNSHPFGYLPSAIHQANYESLLKDYADIVEPNATESYPVLRSRVKDSALLAELVGILVDLCNDYPVYDEERMHQIEHERLINMLNETRAEDDPEAENIAWALYGIGAYIEQSEYGANVSEEDYNDAVAYARQEEAKELARAHGQTELF